QRLHRGVAAARIDEFDVEPVIAPMAMRTRDLIGHDAENLAAEGELEFLQVFLLRGGGAGRGEQAGDGGDAAQHGAAVQIGWRKIGACQPVRHRGGMVGITATHGISPGGGFPAREPWPPFLNRENPSIDLNSRIYLLFRPVLWWPAQANGRQRRRVPVT